MRPRTIISVLLTVFCGSASHAQLGASNWMERTVYQVDHLVQHLIRIGNTLYTQCR